MIRRLPNVEKLFNERFNSMGNCNNCHRFFKDCKCWNELARLQDGVSKSSTGDTINQTSKDKKDMC